MPSCGPMAMHRLHSSLHHSLQMPRDAIPAIRASPPKAPASHTHPAVHGSIVQRRAPQVVPCIQIVLQGHLELRTSRHGRSGRCSGNAPCHAAASAGTASSDPNSMPCCQSAVSAHRQAPPAPGLCLRTGSGAHQPLYGRHVAAIGSRVERRELVVVPRIHLVAQLRYEHINQVHPALGQRQRRGRCTSGSNRGDDAVPGANSA